MKAVIFGMGVSGNAAAEFLSGRGYSVFFYDDNPAVFERYSNGSSFIPYSPDVDYDLAIISPGFSLEHEEVKRSKEKGTDVIGDVELASRYLDSEKIIAVTGTNGKSTTVSLIAAILQEAGYRTFLCGNIGTPVLDAIGKGYEFLVIEISSFQLETLAGMIPDVSVILNVSPDHLDRYSSYEEYLLTKVKLGWLTKPDGILVINGADDALVAGCSPINVEKMFFSFDGNDHSRYSNGNVIVDNFEVDMNRTKLRGAHNVENVMAALLSVYRWITDNGIVNRALQSFQPLPHRMEYVDTIGNVVFIDDSKGTNVGATEKSLAGYDEKSVVLILGGVDKGGSYESLRELAETKCKGIVLIGQSKDVIRPYFDDFQPVTECNSMEDAVMTAYKMAEETGTVLFSPACSSFDWYKNYKERGNDFRKKVVNLKKEKGL